MIRADEHDHIDGTFFDAPERRAGMAWVQVVNAQARAAFVIGRRGQSPGEMGKK